MACDFNFFFFTVCFGLFWIILDCFGLVVDVEQRTSLGIVDLRISEANQPMEEIKLGELSQHGRHSQSRKSTIIYLIIAL